LLFVGKQAPLNPEEETRVSRSSEVTDIEVIGSPRSDKFSGKKRGRFSTLYMIPPRKVMI